MLCERPTSTPSSRLRSNMSAQTAAMTSFAAWVASKGAAVGPPGTKSILTPLAARELWDREARGADVLDTTSVARLDAILENDVKRATAFQALLRGRVDRRTAPAATPSAAWHPTAVLGVRLPPSLEKSRFVRRNLTRFPRFFSGPAASKAPP